MEPIAAATPAPTVPGVSLEALRVLWFYKVTCPVCQMGAQVAESLHAAFPDTVTGVGQDPMIRLEDFAQTYGVTFDSVPDEEPHRASDAYGIRIVPTVFLVEGGRVEDVVESWDRDGYGRIAATLADRTGASPQPVIDVADRLPVFRPG